MCYDPLRFILSFSDLFTPPPSFPPPPPKPTLTSTKLYGAYNTGGGSGVALSHRTAVVSFKQPFQPAPKQTRKTCICATPPQARGHAGGGVTFIVTPLPGRSNICANPPQARGHAGGGVTFIVTPPWQWSNNECYPPPWGLCLSISNSILPPRPGPCGELLHKAL